jgi:hypothetical protein
MSWQETPGESFVARHEARDADDAERVLAQLEAARQRMEPDFETRVGELAVVLHGSPAQLDLAEPWLPVQRALTAPAGRRYLVGWCGVRELHVLAPRLLARRASNVEGSLELLMLAPVALFARRLVAANHPGLPPPFGPRTFRRWLRQAWLVEGAGQWLAGQSRHLRPAVARRLRERPPPAFPPTARDAPLLGGTLFDLLEREEGARACLALARGEWETPRSRPLAALERAFQGRPLRHTEDAWRSHLERLAAGASAAAPSPRRRERSPGGWPRS